MRRIFLVLLVFVIIISLGACSPHLHIDLMGSPVMQEVLLQPAKTKTEAKIAVIDLTGPIVRKSSSSLLGKDVDIVSSVYSRLQRAADDPNVRGIILKLDTPGGELTASDIIYNEVKRFRAKTDKPVIALMMSLAASGGYYVACGCDHIIAHPTTITGSIGVISYFPAFKGLMDKIGVNITVMKKGSMKDVGSPYREMSEGDKAYIDNILDSMYEKFLQVVHDGRKEHLTPGAIKKLADGKVYTAQQALKSKLIDQIGYFEDALNKIKEMAGINNVHIVAYTYHPSRKNNIYAGVSATANPLSLDLKGISSWLPTLKPGFYYLWLPEN